jgi:hypothetical protein
MLWGEDLMGQNHKTNTPLGECGVFNVDLTRGHFA